MEKMQNSQHNTGEEQYNWKTNATQLQILL